MLADDCPMFEDGNRFRRLSRIKSGRGLYESSKIAQGISRSEGSKGTAWSRTSKGRWWGSRCQQSVSLCPRYPSAAAGTSSKRPRGYDLQVTLLRSEPVWSSEGQLGGARPRLSTRETRGCLMIPPDLSIPARRVDSRDAVRIAKMPD